MYITQILFVLFLLLSDNNVTAIITGIFGVVTLLLTLVVIPLLNRIIANQKSSAITMVTMKRELAEAKKALDEAVEYTKEKLGSRQQDRKQTEEGEINTERIISAINKSEERLTNKPRR